MKILQSRASQRTVVRILLCLLFAIRLVGQSRETPRPHILGVAHVALYVSDLEKARRFYEDFLGFQEVFTLKRDDGSVRIAFVKINDKQYLELFTDPPKADGQLNHIAIYTDNAQQMRDYLAEHGVDVPATVAKGKTGNYNFTFKDPDEHSIEVVQYLPEGWTGKNQGKSMQSTRISNRIMHAGLLVGSLDPAMKFYRDVLGFREFWRGSSDGKELSWVNMRVPDGDDYVEFMLYRDTPSVQERGSKNHIALEVSDMEKAVAELETRPGRRSYNREIKVQIGKNRKRQANLFDPDGTRVELMEPNTVDGRPAPSSTTAPPEIKSMPVERQGWRLTWHDEFDRKGMNSPDPSKWDLEVGGKGWGNNELESYTRRLENAREENGQLAIAAAQEEYTGEDGISRSYTSARLKTKNHFTQAYGRFEARIKLPGGQGIWPAFWLLGDDIKLKGWPACGEIDIMESIGDDKTAYGTLHGPGYSGGSGIQGKYVLREQPTFQEGFHVFAVEWEPEMIRFFVDDEMYASRSPKDLPPDTKWVFDHPFFIILNLAVGGKWPGNPNERTVFPQTMLIDYVRVFERAQPSNGSSAAKPGR